MFIDGVSGEDTLDAIILLPHSLALFGDDVERHGPVANEDLESPLICTNASLVPGLVPR